MLAAGLGVFAAGVAGAAGPSRGHDLFSGAAPLRGTIVGHANALPPQAARCVNCHGGSTAGPTAAAASAASFGPLLTRTSLTQPVARRGGPPSRYDRATFCRLLRDGIDPAYVIIPRAMPRYEISDADCEALWLLLVDPGRS